MTCPICQKPMPPGGAECPDCTADALGRGVTLKLRYRLDGLIGRGGFGLTYQAVDLQSGDRIAVKELFPVGATRVGRDVMPTAALRLETLRAIRESFLRIHTAIRGLSHRNLLPIVDLFEQHGTAYAVMPLLHGLTLERHVQKNGPLLGQEARRVAVEVAAGLEQLHGAGFLHRDLKPDNVFLAHDGRVVLIDFDSARMADGTETQSLTRVVSAGYAPIEQYAGEYRFAPAADIYALGATLYYAVQGEAPPSATELVTGTALTPFAANIEAALAEAIRQAMAVKAQDRPQSAQAFVALLTARVAAKVETGAARPPTLFKAHNSAITAIVKGERDTVLTVSDDHTARVWREGVLATGGAPSRTFLSHRDAVCAAAFSDRQEWLTAGEDGYIFIHDQASLHPRRLEHDEGLVGMDVHGDWVAAAGADRVVRVWQIADGVPLGTSARLPHWVKVIRYAKAGESLFVGLQDGRLLMLHGGSARLIAERSAHVGPVRALVPFEAGMLSAGADGRVCFWDEYGEKLDDIQVSATPLLAVDADVYGRILAADDGGHLYSLGGGQAAPERLAKLPGQVSSLKITGNAVLIGLTDGRLQVRALPDLAASVEASSSSVP